MNRVLLEHGLVPAVERIGAEDRVVGAVCPVNESVEKGQAERVGGRLGAEGHKPLRAIVAAELDPPEMCVAPEYATRDNIDRHRHRIANILGDQFFKVLTVQINASNESGKLPVSKKYITGERVEH